MSTAKATTRKRLATQPELAKSGNLDLDLDLSSYIKGITSALQQIREKAHKHGLKKNEETISRRMKEFEIFEMMFKALPLPLYGTVKKKMSAQEVQELVNGDRNVPLVVDFFAIWCGPCILMDQELEMNVPVFSIFFWSSSINFISERLWILPLLYTGLNFDDDAHVYIKNSILETLLSFYVSPLSDKESKELILQIINKDNAKEGDREANGYVTREGIVKGGPE